MATQPEHFPFPGEDAKEPLTKPVKLAKREKEPVALAPANPWSLIQLAVSQNADIAKLEKLMELQMRWEANEAKKAFVAAMNAFKAEPPEIAKNRWCLLAQGKPPMTMPRSTKYARRLLMASASMESAIAGEWSSMTELSA